MKKAYWGLIRPFLLPLVGGFLLLGLVLWLKPSVWLVALFVTALTIWGTFKSGGNLSQNLFINLLFLFSLWGLWRLVGGLGLLGLLFACLVVGVVIIYRRRKVFMATIRGIEKIIWGRTNDRKP